MPWFVFAIASSLFASLSSIIEKRALARVHSTDFSLMTAGMIALCSLPFFLIESTATITPRALLAIYVVSVLGAFAFLEVTKGVRHMEISASAPLFLLSPFITALIAFFALGETMHAGQLAGIGLLALGTYILETRDLRDMRGFIDHFIGDRYARLIVIGLLCYGVTATIDRVILGMWHIPPMIYIGIVHLFIFLNFLVYVLWRKRPLRTVFADAAGSWKLLLLVALFTIAYRLSYSYAVSMTAVALVIAIKRSSSLFTTVIGGELFHDHALLRKSIACAIMISGVVLMALK